MTDFEKCPRCGSTDIETTDNGSTFKVICRKCGRILEATDTTPYATEKSRKATAMMVWNKQKKYKSK